MGVCGLVIVILVRSCVLDRLVRMDRDISCSLLEWAKLLSRQVRHAGADQKVSNPHLLFFGIFLVH